MNRKSSIAAAAIAAILIFLFSQAYVKRIQKVNSKHKEKSESSVISRDEFNAEIGNIYIENPQETQPEVPDATSDSQLYIINENNEIVPVEEQTTTESKSLLERRKKKNEDSQLYILNEDNELVPAEEQATESKSLLERRKKRNENKDESNETIENNNNE